jgi:hypothetical protein
MAEILQVVDLEALRKEVREKYREVAAILRLSITSIPGAPTPFDSATLRRYSTSFPITRAKLLRASAILSFGAARSMVRELSISDLALVWIRSWLRFGWAAKVR